MRLPCPKWTASYLKLKHRCLGILGLDFTLIRQLCPALQTLIQHAANGHKEPEADVFKFFEITMLS